MNGKSPLAHRQGGKGFTLLELLVVCAIVGILATAALGRLWDLQADVEKVMAEQVLGALKNAARIRAAGVLSASRWDEFRSMPQGNPFDWLEEPPGNYRGELKGVGEPGNWYFDKNSATTIYYIKHADAFRPREEEPVMRFRVVGLDSAGRQISQGGFSWVGVRPLADYVWRGKIVR
jgi:prepilin-type N-terminal cleavage/methylation domain-containing protein